MNEHIQNIDSFLNYAEELLKKEIVLSKLTDEQKMEIELITIPRIRGKVSEILDKYGIWNNQKKDDLITIISLESSLDSICKEIEEAVKREIISEELLKVRKTMREEIMKYCQTMIAEEVQKQYSIGQILMLGKTEMQEKIKIGGLSIKEIGDIYGIKIHSYDNRDLLLLLFKKLYNQDNIEDILQAGENGFFKKDGKRYGHYYGWSIELGISWPTIKSRLKGIEGITGKDSGGHIIKKGFYSEIQVKEACKDLLEEMPQAGENGFFEKDGERYNTTRGWAKELGISQHVINNRLQGIEGITGKDRMRRIIKKGFYSEIQVKEACKDLLEEMLQAGENGFFEKNGERYNTIGGWAKELGISQDTIDSRLQSIEGITGKTLGGQVRKYYSESQVMEACKDLLEEMQQAGKDGFFEKDGERYGTIVVWAEELKISEPSIKSRLKGIEGITGKDRRGYVSKEGFYSESQVKKACKDLLEEMQQAGKDGFFEKDGERYGTIGVWAEELGISEKAINSRLKGIEGITGKAFGGQVSKYYSESQVKKACKDLLEEMQQAGKDGFFERDGERYNTIGGWAQELGIFQTSIKGCLQDIEGITGKTFGGQVRKFYSESQIMEACKDLLEKQKRNK